MTTIRQLVVDADVARAASKEETDQSEDGTLCRDALVEIMSAKHRIVMGKVLLAEWKKHQSAFARAWQVEMVIQNLVDLIDDSPDSDHWDLVFQDLVQSGSVESQNILAMIRKDLHLMEAAIKTDNRVLSCDNRVRGHIARQGRSSPELMGVIWVNPKERSAIAWISGGCPDDDSRKLEHHDKR